jgi:UDP-glucose:(heptosyl)LPS alpha-1,3-glucosyltransferase
MSAANMPHPPEAVQSSAASRRVIFVRQHFTPYGGAGLILDRTIAALSARGMRVSLLGRSWPGRADVEFIRCDPPRFPRFRRERAFARAACKRLVNESEAIVQAHERMACCDIFRAGDGVHATFIEQRMRGLGAIARTVLSLDPFHRSVIALEQEMFASRRLQAVIANSQMVADDIATRFSFPRDRIHLVPNGIDLDRFHPAVREKFRDTTRKQLGTPPSRPVVLFVGSGFKRKGLDAAIAAVAANRNDAELWVIGDDRRPGSYTTIAHHAGLPGTRFRLIGPVPDPLPYYAAADVLILPSIYDPFPSTALEALACGLPVVTSESCGAREAAVRLDPALVRDAYDHEGLAVAVDRATELASKRATVDAARAIASAYSIDNMIDRTLAVYATLDAGARR